MNKIAVVFPGQGSQSEGMLADVAEAFPVLLDTFTEASDVLGYDMWQVAQHNPNEQLHQTEFTQPALLTASVALWRLIAEHCSADVFAGHSLGEYSALVCADALAFADAVQLVQYRGQCMQQAVPVGVGAMAAIIGIDDDVLATLCHQAADNQVLSPANFNTLGQTVVAGNVEAVDRLLDLAKAHGAKIATKIPVSVPSHCALMTSAAEKFAKALAAVTIQPPKVPVIHNVDARLHTSPDEIKQALIAQLNSAVQWVNTMQMMVDREIDTLVECGPGKVLTGLMKRFDRGMTSFNIGTLAGLTGYRESV